MLPTTATNSLAYQLPSSTPSCACLSDNPYSVKLCSLLSIHLRLPFSLSHFKVDYLKPAYLVRLKMFV